MESYQRTFVYRIDSQDRIVFVDDEWLAFAQENSAPGLTCEAVLEEPVWEFITDIETQHLYSTLFRRLRDGQSVAPIPFRCDSPDRRRFMEMQVTALPEAGVEIRTRLLREETRQIVEVLGDSGNRADELLRMCSSCKKVKLSMGWVDVEEAIALLDLFGELPLPMITHSICPSCIDLFL